jgi:acetolactate synthase small subunit
VALIEQDTVNDDADTIIEKIVNAAYKLVDVERVSVFEVDRTKKDQEIMLKVRILLIMISILSHSLFSSS